MSALNLSHPMRPMQMLLDDFVPEQASAFLVLLRAKVRALAPMLAFTFALLGKVRTCSMH